MNQAQALKYAIKLLNKAKFPYMITGAYAVSYYGEPRATHDLDIVMEISRTDVDKICRIFGAGGYEFDRNMIENAATYHSHFTVIHSDSNLRIDFWMVRNKNEDRARFARRRKIKLFDLPTAMISPEDIILVKLKWFAESKNIKHFNDAAGIIRVQQGKLDFPYIAEWLETLGIKGFWRKACSEAKKAGDEGIKI